MATVLARNPRTISDLEAAIAANWMRETSADPGSWTVENAAWGQCAVTALVVQDYFGGTLLRGEVGPVSHYWNVLPSGEEIDLTRHQFPDGVAIEGVASRTREYVLSHLETARRYRALASAVHRCLRTSVRQR
jgi:hypothetical protein